MGPIAPETWLTIGSLSALISVILAIVALGWDGALRALTLPEPPPSSMRFQPRLIPPAALLCLLVFVGSATIVLAVLTVRPLLLLFAPFLVVLAQRAALTIAVWRYQHRLRRQVLVAITRLEALTRGSQAILTGFQQVGAGSDWPLREEWAWVHTHVNVRYVDPETGQTRHSDHADALRALARQTLLDIHAQVLGHLASIYEEGAESNAPERLRMLVDVLTEQDRLQRDLGTQFNHVRGEAYIISGALGLIVLWLLVSQTERVAAAFLVSPFGPYALLWFAFWLALPIAAALLLTRPPDLPL